MAEHLHGNEDGNNPSTLLDYTRMAAPIIQPVGHEGHGHQANHEDLGHHHEHSHPEHITMGTQPMAVFFESRDVPDYEDRPVVFNDFPVEPVEVIQYVAPVPEPVIELPKPIPVPVIELPREKPAPAPTPAPEPEPEPARDGPSPHTFIYKTTDKCEVPLDLYLPAKANKVPILIWFHGGGLLQGTRKAVAPHMLRGISKYNYALISADYRLAPQVGVKDILEDVKDLFAFIRTKLPSKLQSDTTLDTTRIAVSGSSAGGYLAMLAGLWVTPRPNTVLAIYPITNPLGAFFTKPREHPDGKIEDKTVEPFLRRDAEVATSNGPDSARNKMYYYMMQSANLAELLGLNHDSVHKHGDWKFVIPHAMEIAGRDAMPPTYIVHGDADRFVGVEQADEVIGIMRRKDVIVHFEKVKGKDHLFDKEESEEMAGMYEWMQKYWDWKVWHHAQIKG